MGQATPRILFFLGNVVFSLFFLLLLYLFLFFLRKLDRGGGVCNNITI